MKNCKCRDWKEYAVDRFYQDFDYCPFCGTSLLSPIEKERKNTYLALKRICEEYGDTDFDEDLQFSDILTKHLEPHLIDLAQVIFANEEEKWMKKMEAQAKVYATDLKKMRDSMKIVNVFLRNKSNIRCIKYAFLHINDCIIFVCRH